MGVLPGLWSLTPLGALLGVLVLTWWLLATGRLISRSTHERELGMANRRGDEWKETALDGRELNAELVKQNKALVDSNTALDQFLRSVGSAGPARSGDPDVVA